MSLMNILQFARRKGGGLAFRDESWFGGVIGFPSLTRTVSDHQVEIAAAY
jgi:hypothetical protein